MKTFKFILIVLVVVLCSCEKEGLIKDNDNDTVLYVPMPKTVIGDALVHLQWSDAMWAEYIYNPFQTTITPDVLEFFVSDKPDDREAGSVGEVNFNKKSYTINGLANGKPLYIYLLAKKKGYKTQKSEMIMVVPNKRKEYEYILRGAENQYFWDLAVSPDGTKIAYVDNYEWGNGNYSALSLFIANINGTNARMIAKSGYKPSWSPDGTKIAFHSEDGEINVGNGFPAQIAIYNCNTGIMSKLTAGNYVNYNPSFSNDGNFLIYQSNENLQSGNNPSNILTLNLQTLEKSQQSTMPGTYEFPTEYFSHFLFSGKISSFENVIGICIPLSNNVQLIEKFRNDYRPALSPDKKKVAFISDRSGMSQVWVYEIETHKFTQVTGYDENESIYYYNWSKINWIDNSTLVFTMNFNEVLRQKI